jgi:predicted nucleic acid-binding protein
VAFLIKEEIHHEWTKAQFRQLPAPFLTCEPVLTETFYLIRNVAQGPVRFFDLVNSGLLRTDFSVLGEGGALEKLVLKDADVPMSLTDACLVRLSELVPESAIFTLDADFGVYRKHGRRTIPTIMPGR